MKYYEKSEKWSNMKHEWSNKVYERSNKQHDRSNIVYEWSTMNNLTNEDINHTWSNTNVACTVFTSSHLKYGISFTSLSKLLQKFAITVLASMDWGFVTMVYNCILILM